MDESKRRFLKRGLGALAPAAGGERGEGPGRPSRRRRAVDEGPAPA